MEEESIRVIHLSYLAASFSTRSRGAEAYEQLLHLLEDGPVVLDLDDVGVMPVSFLDAIILRLMDSGHTEDVAFKATNARARDKLRRLSGLRGVDLFLHGHAGTPEKLKPRPPEALQVQEVPDYAEGASTSS